MVNLIKFLVDSRYYTFIRFIDCENFLPFLDCLFSLMIGSFAEQKLLGLIKSHLSILAFVAIAFCVLVMKTLPRFSSRYCLGFLLGFLWC